MKGQPDRSLVFLSIITAFYSLSQAVTGTFLPNYYLNVGLSVNQIIILISATLLSLGVLPILFLKFFRRSFEKMLIAGIILSLVFLFFLMFVKNPLMLGRLANLVPVYVFINNFDFSNYFLTLGLISLVSIAFFFAFKKLHDNGKIAIDIRQK